MSQAAAAALFLDGFEGERLCPVPTHFASAQTPAFEIHVATDGDNDTGTGSEANPYATLRRAIDDAAPGSAIIIHEGTYAGGNFVAGLRGTADAPIWITGAPGEALPVFQGGGTAIQFSRPAFLVLRDIAVRGAANNGINIDDGGDVADPLAAHHVVVEGLDIADVGAEGNQDCLKISGLRDSWILDNRFENCGGGGSGVDFVGGHRSLVFGNRFTDIGASGVQAKGGSHDIEIRANVFDNGGSRALNMGGSTGLPFFRPPLSTTAPNFEARNIRAIANLFIGSQQAPLNFVGCVACSAVNNTLVDSGTWLVRILQETTSQGGFTFEPVRDGLIRNNLFYFRRSDIGNSAINVGPNTAPETFRWENNLFYAYDNPGASAPNPPGSETGSLIGLDPLIAGPGYAIGPTSPAAGAGADIDPALADLDGECFAQPPSIGAREVLP